MSACRCTILAWVCVGGGSPVCALRVCVLSSSFTSPVGSICFDISVVPIKLEIKSNYPFCSWNVDIIRKAWAIRSVGVTEDVLPCNGGRFCNSVELVILHICHPSFGSVPGLLASASMGGIIAGGGWLSCPLTLSGVQYPLFRFSIGSWRTLGQFVPDCIWSTVGHWSYNRLSLVSNDC